MITTATIYRFNTALKIVAIDGLRKLPWRATRDPYKIAVSEIMLQQTQVPRVVEKYKAFLKVFPTVHALAAAPRSEVLRLWSGLGYNRRAKYLHQMAAAVVKQHKGRMPKDLPSLLALPGIGPYTGRAIITFAYNTPEVFIETNIRTVFIHHFFPGKQKVSDSVIAAVIAKTIDIKNPRQWYWMLMDYGTVLKHSGNKAHRKGSEYKKQSTFIGSRRQVRGAILRALLSRPLTLSAIKKILGEHAHDVGGVLNDLTIEQLIEKKGRYYKLQG